jgi:tRNA G18 (ribose-2'-O)-methylase SpoU
MKFLKPIEIRRSTAKESLTGPSIPVWIILDNVRSGLNVGSVFRTADAFSIRGISLCGITAIPPDRSVLKTALGATESVKWQKFDTTEEAVKEAKSKGYAVYAVEQSDSPLWLNELHVDGNSSYALIFGHEVHGVDEKLIPYLDGCIEVPQSGSKHSLNIAVCCGVVCWQFYCSLHK